MGIRQGQWIARFTESQERPDIGKVKEVHDDGSIDIIFYDCTGRKVGRVSPAMGGPTSYEPCCGAEFWEPIQAPNFDAIADVFFYGRHLARIAQATTPTN